MATLAANVSSSTSGVVDGVYTSPVFTANGTFTLNIWGNFAGAKGRLEISTYNDGTNDVYIAFREGIRGRDVQNIETDPTIKYRFIATDLSPDSSIFVTTGGGNT